MKTEIDTDYFLLFFVFCRNDKNEECFYIGKKGNDFRVALKVSGPKALALCLPGLSV